MSNILPKVVDGVLTYTSPSKISRYSAYAVRQKLPCLFVKTNGNTLKKVDDILSINEIDFNISKKTVKDVCLLLKDNNFDVSFIEFDTLLDYPALVLNDIRNEEVFEEKVLSSPLDLQKYNFSLSRNLISKTTEIEVLYSVDKQTKNKVATNVVKNMLYVKPLTTSTYFMYKITANMFIWTCDLNSIVTSNKEFTSKMIE